jgi:cytochrome c553
MILFRNLAITALFIMVSAGLSASNAFAQDAQEGNAPADLARGEQLFQLCTQCHGSAGGGNAEFLAPGIAGLPDWYVVAQLEKFHSGARGLNPKDTGGLRMYPMSLWLREDSDRRAVSAYVASLPRQAPKNEFHEPGDAEKGAGYYAVCSACHMADGSGNQGMGAPPLTDMSDWYLYSSIEKYKAGIRGSGKGDSLGPVMIGMAATLPDPDAIRDVIAYIQTLGKN